MDKSLDEILAESGKQTRGGSRGPRGGRRGGNRRDDYPRDGVRKNYREESRKLDDDWVHDRFEENGSRRSRQPNRRRESPDQVSDTRGTKIRVDNLHYELTEEDISGLFDRIGPVSRLELKYDRAGRSDGTAYITYESNEDARKAVKEFDGANAKGQPIRLAILPSGPAGRPRNAFDTAVKPGSGRSLADRITRPGHLDRARSESPGRDLDEEAARKGIDRYVPGRNGSRSRSPLPRGRRDGGRRPGDRRGGAGGGPRQGGQGGRGGPRQGRPVKKTQDELDAEMADYFGSGSKNTAQNDSGTATVNGQAGAAQVHDDDIDMIE